MPAKGKVSEVEVAVLGPSTAYAMGTSYLESPSFEDQGWELAWNARMRTTVEINEQTTLADVVNTAADRFGVRVPLGGQRGRLDVTDVIDGIGFWKSGDDHRDGYPGPFKSYFVGVDEEGRALWGDARWIRMSDLIRAADRGILDNDPTRVYFSAAEPQGGEILLAFWSDFWAYPGPVLVAAEHVVAGVEAYAMGKRALARLRKGDALQRLQEKFERRGATPPQVLELLRSKPWSPAQLAEAIDTTEDEAGELLEFAGYEQTESDGTWAPGTEGDARLVQRLLESVIQSAAAFNPWPGTMSETAWIEEATAELLKSYEETNELLSPVEWAQRWRPSEFLDPPVDPPVPEPDETPDGMVEFESPRKQYRVISVPTSQGIDVQALQEALDAAGDEQFSIAVVWKRQKLQPRGRGHVLIMSRDVWETGELDAN